MPWRLIAVIVIFAIFLAFITFNLDNRCNISFGLVKFEDVPVFLTVFISFVFGIFCTLPFLFRALKMHKERRPQKITREREDDYPYASTAEPIDAREARKKFLSRFKNKKKSKGISDD
jgi:uncharacterized integral membrane protein